MGSWVVKFSILLLWSIGPNMVKQYIFIIMLSMILIKGAAIIWKVALSAT